MPENNTEFQENCTRKLEPKRMRYSADAALIEGSQLVRDLGGDGPVKSRISRAVRLVSEFLAEPMSPGRAENLLRREARPQAHEMDALRAARKKQREDAARAKARELADTYARIACGLAARDEEFYSDEITRLLSVAGQLGHVDSAMADRAQPYSEVEDPTHSD